MHRSRCTRGHKRRRSAADWLASVTGSASGAQRSARAVVVSIVAAFQPWPGTPSASGMSLGGAAWKNQIAAGSAGLPPSGEKGLFQKPKPAVPSSGPDARARTVMRSGGRHGNSRRGRPA